MFSNRKIEKLSEVNQKINELQNSLLINMEYSSGKEPNNLIIDSLLINDENWIETIDFGANKNTKYKPIKFYDDSSLIEFENSKILKEFEFENFKYIILDKTIFYPTMGGQACDLGVIGSKKVIDVIKIGGVILHKTEN